MDLNPQNSRLGLTDLTPPALVPTSGLRVHGFGGYSTTDIPTLPQILRGDPPANNEQISLFTFPGLGAAYSGGGFTVIQLILETHLRKPFYQIMDETVLQPLKMSRSTYKTLADTEKNYVGFEGEIPIYARLFQDFLPNSLYRVLTPLLRRRPHT
jgi:hypothetical protein